MSVRKHCVIMTIVVSLFVSVLSQTNSCKKIDECSCKLNDAQGSIISLKPLITKTDGSPLFKDEHAQDGQYYSYNPCYNFTEGDCKDGALCQKASPNGTAKLVVSQNRVEFGYDGTNVQITYFTTDGLPTQANVGLKCFDNLSTPKLIAYGFQNDTRIYQFELQSMCACPNVCSVSPNSSSSSSISGGSVVLIIFFVIVALYLILGTVHGKVVRKAQGAQILPNYEFWTGLPSLLKEGCLCVVRWGTCTPARKTYDEV